MLLLTLLAGATSQNHCQRKCELNYKGSSKYDTCLATCEKLIKRNPIIIEHSTKKEVADCMKKCSEDGDSRGVYPKWSKCRKQCMIPKTTEKKEQQEPELEFYPPNHCLSDCEKYWKGTVHHESCNQQCDSFKKNYEKRKLQGRRNLELVYQW